MMLPRVKQGTNSRGSSHENGLEKKKYSSVHIAGN